MTTVGVIGLVGTCVILTLGCLDGFYGGDCSNACGSCGNNSSCHHETGSCPGGCQTGWQLDLCNEACADGKYGLNCVARCGHCNGSCDIVDGRCLQECTRGYRESKKILPNKMTHSSTKVTSLGVVDGLVGVALTLMLADGVYLCLRYRQGGLHRNHRPVKGEGPQDTGKSFNIKSRIETCVYTHR